MLLTMLSTLCQLHGFKSIDTVDTKGLHKKRAESDKPLAFFHSIKSSYKLADYPSTLQNI